MEHPPKVVLTGATGFIGAAVLTELLARGAKPLVLLRAGSDHQRIAALQGFREVPFQRFDEAGLAARLQEEQPSVFIHCAWGGVFGTERNVDFQITENLPLTLAAAQLAVACGCRQWIGLGSQAEYGNQNRVLDESAPARPTTTYGKAKLAAGIATLALCEARGLAGTWLRVFSTYGPGEHPQRLVPHLISEFAAGHAPKLTGCEQLWDYLYVTDAARAIVAVAERQSTGVFNLGSGQVCPLRQVVETIRAGMSTALQPEYGAVPYRPDQVMHLQADITRLKSATGWQPQVSLEEGLRACLASPRPKPNA